jgi:hypothetical protein
MEKGRIGAELRYAEYAPWRPKPMPLTDQVAPPHNPERKPEGGPLSMIVALVAEMREAAICRYVRTPHTLINGEHPGRAKASIVLMRAMYIKARARSAHEGSGTAGWSLAAPVPVCFLMEEEDIAVPSWQFKGNKWWSRRSGAAEWRRGGRKWIQRLAPRRHGYEGELSITT